MIHKLKIVFTLLFFTTLMSCKKIILENSDLENNVNKSKINYLPEIENSSITYLKDKEVLSFIEHTKNSKLKIDFNNALIYKISFKNFPSLNGIYLKRLEYGQRNKEIFFVSDKNSNNNLLIEREKNYLMNNNYIYISIRDINNNLIFSEQLVNNLIIKKVNINKLTPFNNLEQIKSFDLSLEWNCSQEKFNALYQEAKAKCEEDFLCDIACSINPCFISYLAYAVGKCSGLIK